MGSIPNDDSYQSTTSSSGAKYTLSIIGGGIGGLALAIGLLKYPHIDVQIYESAHNFGEIGAGITIGPNAQRALEIIGPDADAAFKKHATPNSWASHANNYTLNLVGYGDKDGEIIEAQKNRTGMQCVHRARFLDELVRPIPQQRCHFGKRLVSFEDPGSSHGTPGKITMHFKDGTSATTDAIIGADGIHSSVRKIILGAGHPASEPQFAHSATWRGMVTMDQAREKLGAEYAENSTMLTGPGRAFLSYPIDHGETSNIVMMEYNIDTWDHEKWIVPRSKDDLVKRVKGWGETAHNLVDLMATNELAQWAMFDSAPAPYYNKGAVCIMGDAAHATTPFQGQGAAQAIEDACTLQALLGECHDVANIPMAFSAYDQVRRPRTQRMVTTSRESGDLLGWTAPGVGSDIEKIRQKLKTRMHWLWNRDLTAQNDSAIAIFKEGL